jgi:hypothetical protein
VETELERTLSWLINESHFPILDLLHIEKGAWARKGNNSIRLNRNDIERKFDANSVNRPLDLGDVRTNNSVSHREDEGYLRASGVRCCKFCDCNSAMVAVYILVITFPSAALKGRAMLLSLEMCMNLANWFMTCRASPICCMCRVRYGCGS